MAYTPIYASIVRTRTAITKPFNNENKSDMLFINYSLVILGYSS